MIYLTTGANGAGKTLLMLRDVRQAQLESGRPVYFHGFAAGDVLTREFGWKPFDPKLWQDLPDGSICVMDECQNEFPLRRAGSDVPGYINAVAQHRRRRGFDFWMTCPHPMLIDVFIRRLIDNPSWHRHIKRTAGAHLVSVSKWNAVRVDCEKPGSGESGEVSLVPYPKEVFNWYQSASLHTAKRKMPRAVWVMLACVVAVPVLGYFAVRMITGQPESTAAKIAKAGPGATAVGSAAPGRGSVPAKPAAASPVLGAREYVAAREPRIPGLAHTAPAYDVVTQPQSAPYPAACIEGRPASSKFAECNCYTSQGTKLQTPADLCRQIVRNGYFIEWHREGVAMAAPAASGPVVARAPVPESSSVEVAARPVSAAPTQ